ncbi:hypothetical protein [Paenibacillus sp. FSL R7-277]|uniref:hypothetical protein n=1 Tax=Paenibacillus sp. FSL R7-277 TaxID=1227352 RepID=UPI001F4446C2|nr:hypothetical protein [Paenibacillus sp. FSL R7-277]
MTCSIVYPSVSFCPLGYIAIVPETGEEHQYGLSPIQSDNCHPGNKWKRYRSFKGRYRFSEK